MSTRKTSRTFAPASTPTYTHNRLHRSAEWEHENILRCRTQPPAQRRPDREQDSHPTQALLRICISPHTLVTRCPAGEGGDHRITAQHGTETIILIRSVSASRQALPSLRATVGALVFPEMARGQESSARALGRGASGKTAFAEQPARVGQLVLPGGELSPAGRTSMAPIFPFINWFSVAARSRRSRVSCIGFLPLSMSTSTWPGIIVRTWSASPSTRRSASCTSFLRARLSAPTRPAER